MTTTTSPHPTVSQAEIDELAASLIEDFDVDPIEAQMMARIQLGLPNGEVGTVEDMPR